MKCNNFKYFKLVLFFKNLAMFFTPLNFWSLCKKDSHTNAMNIVDLL